MKGLTLALVAAMSGLAQADEFERQHGSHDHGAAQLDLVLEAQVLELQLLSPAINLVGFEHRAVDEPERQQVEQTVATLKQGYQMLQLPDAAACLLDEARVEQTLLEGEADEHESHAEHADHAYRDATAGHADFAVHYRFRCASPDKLDHIGVELFRYFPGLESLEVRMITPSGQRGLRLEVHHTEIRL